MTFSVHKPPASHQAIVNQVLDGIDFSGFSFQRIIDRVAFLRKRPISVVAWPMPDTTQYGLWLTSPAQEFIFFERDTAIAHQEFIILHELSHILLGHETLDITSPQAVFIIAQRALVCELSDLHLADREQEAETLARLLHMQMLHRLKAAQLRQAKSEPVMQEFWRGIGF